MPYLVFIIQRLQSNKSVSSGARDLIISDRHDVFGAENQRYFVGKAFGYVSRVEK